MFSGRRKSPATKARAKTAVAGALTVGAGVLGFGSTASAAEPTQQELLEQIKALQSKVEQLEARQDQQAEKQQGATTRPAAAQAEPEATIGSVLEDAERRSSPQFMQSGGFTAGYSKNKFLIQDEAGNFVLNPNVQFQFRHVVNFREEDTGTGSDGEGDGSVESGFEIRRLKFAFDGTLFGPALTYKFQWATNRGNGTPVLDDAWVRWAVGNTFGEGAKDFAVRVGQFKDPTFHEEIVSSKRQLAVDRSLANEVLAGGLTDWTQGIALIWDDGPEGRPLRAEVGFGDGWNTDNTNFVDSGGVPVYGAGSPDWGAFARLEYLAMGNWKQYDDFSTMDNTTDMLVFGVGATYSETSGAGGGDSFLYTADVQYEAGKLGLYGAYYGAYGEPAVSSTVTESSISESGILVQAGYLLGDKWELFGRYDVLLLDDARLAAGAEDTYSEVTIGLNYYIKGHAAKFTVDFNYLPQGTPNNQDGIGYLDPDNDEDQFAIRSQFQLLL